MNRSQAAVPIMALCGVLFLLNLILEGSGIASLQNVLGLMRTGDATLFYRVFTYAFIHNSFFHLLANMLVLFFALPSVEAQEGPRRTLILFFTAALFCGLVTLLHQTFVPWSGRTVVVGASGAVCALLFLFWRSNPDATVLLFFIIPLPIRYVMIGAIALDVTGTVFSLPTGLAHVTHAAGYLFGYLYLKYGGRLDMAVSARRNRRHLKLVQQQAKVRREKRFYYEEQIDPILKKVSEQGMDSLSDVEKHILKKAKEYRREHGLS
ncbi:MAG: hypothetical protein A2293_08280 [Elusimicrobia bacterium RIFOXYB2_FULL_49_7]|nr:MAG: hypothetical protein A2293_08280 [Elusimicrobia bacterium RIFOXYB2_FULL_49_7]